MDEWMDGWMDGRINGWRGLFINFQIFSRAFVQTFASLSKRRPTKIYDIFEMIFKMVYCLEIFAFFFFYLFGFVFVLFLFCFVLFCFVFVVFCFFFVWFNCLSRGEKLVYWWLYGGFIALIGRYLAPPPGFLHS